jgi:hypothetical protein
MSARIRTAARPLVLAARCAAATALLLAVALPGAAGAQTGAAGDARVVIALLPLPDEPPELEEGAEPPLAFRPILDRLAAREELSIGMSSAAQGQYDPLQALLDITQGTRVSLSGYEPKRPPELTLIDDGEGGLLQGWLETTARAETAPADLVPGLLAGSIPGGAGYVGVSGRSQTESIVAADRAGRIPAISIGSSRDVARRVQRQLASRRLVVTGLPTGIPSDVELDRLIEQRRPQDLLIVMQTPPEVRGAQLLPVGIAGLGAPPRELSSDTTHLDGIIAGIDILPTVLDWLGIPVPDEVKGQPIELVDGRSAAALESRADRLRVVLPRRLPALWTLVGGWIALLLLAVLVADRRGLRWSLRVGPLAVLWVPAVVLLTAAIEPSRTNELLLVAVLSLVLGALTDRLIAWPRGPALPAAVGLAAYLVDLAAGSPLIIRSLLGPNPLFGSRFFGIGNELEATLSALLVIGLGALLYGRGRSRGAVAAFAGGGVILAITVGAGRLGADVGGVITVAAGAATAALLMLPGGLTARAVLVALVTPALALGLLAVIDIVTGGDAHFTRTVLRAESGDALWDVVARRYELAGRAAIRGFMPAATLIAVLAIAVGLRLRRRILEPVGMDPAIVAAIGGALAVGVGGALFNDSGPVLLLFATFLAGCAVLYVRGDPRLVAEPGAPAEPPVTVVADAAPGPAPVPGGA